MMISFIDITPIYYAQQVFDKIPEPGFFPYSLLISMQLSLNLVIKLF